MLILTEWDTELLASAADSVEHFFEKKPKKQKNFHCDEEVHPLESLTFIICLLHS